MGTKEIKPEIVINDFDTFRYCIQKSNEQREFVGNGDRRFEMALSELVQRDHELYMKFVDKLHKKYREARK